MSFLKDIKEIKSSLNQLNDYVTGNTSQRAKKADELEKYLSNVGLRIKSISYPISSDGKTDICIIYEAPQVILKFDDNDEPVENPTFKAINMLNLLPNEDMIKLSNAINQRRGRKKR